MDISSILKIKDFFNFADWLEDRRYGKHNENRKLARRILRVLDAHDIPAARIPWIFPEFNFQIKDFKDLESVIAIINNPFLDCFTQKFFLNRSWLDTGEGPAQTQFEFGYDFDNVFNYLSNLENKENEFIFVNFIAQDGTRFTPVENHGTDHGILIVIEITTRDQNDSFEYTRYLPFYIGYWHYYKTRMMIKGLSLLCFQLQLNQSGCFSKNANYQGLENLLAVELIKTVRIKKGEWHPDDYIFTSKKSLCSKDREDAGRMHDYLRDISYFNKIKNLRPSRYLD